MGLRAVLGAPVPAASLRAFRVLFGLLAALAAVRFVALGWVHELLVAPRFHFAFVEGVSPAPEAVLYAVFAVQAAAGLAVALGVWSRPALAVWLVSFGYVELLDKALYLNHYVLFSLLGLWLFVAPVHGPRSDRPSHVPAWALYLLRAQVATVYLWAGLAKLNADWLLAAQPLRTWLGARADVPVLGPLLASSITAYGMSWAGALYDLLIPALLLWRRTRGVGLLLVAGFHVAVGLLFPIGVFPLIMMASATLFLDPEWPTQVRSRLRGPDQRPEPPTPRGLGRGATVLWCATVGTMLLFPARFLLYGDHPSWTEVNWTERGYRFAWRVLLNEKTGLVDFRVVERGSGRVWRVMPSHELSELQHAQLRTQPDLMRDYALHLQDLHRREGRDVAVYADAWVSLNGRPSQRILRDDLDLTLPLSELDRRGFILPLVEPAR
ncbi:MAG: HTTM domain-containing protein [Polyangiales bacterium]